MNKVGSEYNLQHGAGEMNVISKLWDNAVVALKRYNGAKFIEETMIRGSFK